MALEDLLLAKPLKGEKPVPVEAVALSGLARRMKSLSARERRFVENDGFLAESGRHVLITDAEGNPARVLFGLGDGRRMDPFLPARLARLLPAATYELRDFPEPRLTALGWLMEAYAFARYRKQPQVKARLLCPSGVDRAALLSEARAVHATRDLVNTPASDMGPDELESAALALARKHKGKASLTKGAKLAREFPMIHAVGRASPRAPRLIDLTFGPAKAPKLTLVGKGVCFDTGGLDIKPSSSMLLMKKDMGGAAHVLGLAAMVLEAKIPVRLRVLIPAVENSIAGDAFRPGDVLTSRKGLTIEIGNTDAEGRLVLADALALADAEKPDLLISMATLTGAARVALGPDMPPFYTDDDTLAAKLAKAAEAENDPLWRLPFWQPYYRLFESRIADMNNAGEGGYAGSITAALFLRRFVEQAASFLHFDIFAWTPSARPGRPAGAEAQAIRALFSLIWNRYK